MTDAVYFGKPMVQKMVRPVVGNGLLLAEGDTWKRQRRMVQPAFHRQKLAKYADHMASCTEALLASWTHDTVRDVYADMTELTLRIAGKTLFGAVLGVEAERASRALSEACGIAMTISTAVFRYPWLTIPSPGGLRIRRASRDLESLVYSLIAERRKSGELRDDLLVPAAPNNGDEDAAVSRFIPKCATRL